MTDISDSLDINDRNRKSWTQDQDNILIRLVKKYGVKRWTDISKAMIEMFDLVGKTGKQCRQRWVNHLDPKINKQQWTIQQERKIFDSHKISGNKWKIIAKQLDNRTDNSIKNHFYSILRKGLRRINKMMGDRKSTEKVKDIRTSVLSKLSKLENEIVSEKQKVQSEKKRINVSNIYELLFQFSSMKSGNISQKNLSSQSLKQQFKQMIVHLMSLSSQQKKKKEQNIAQNKEKKNRKNSSQQLIEEESDADQMQEEQSMRCLDNQNNESKNEYNPEDIFYQTNFGAENKLNGFLVNLQSPEKHKNYNQFNNQYEKYFSTNNQIKDQKTRDFQNAPNLNHKNSLNSVIIIQKQEENQMFSQKGEDFNIFPNITINLEQQSLNLSCGQSKDGGNDFNLCFNKSPIFNSAKMFDKFNLRTPRILSPGAFNLCSSISTAHSMGNYAVLTGKDSLDQKSNIVQNQYDKMLQQLRSNIHSNCNLLTPINNSLRVNSSKNSCIQSFLRPSYSTTSLTPSSGKAH